MNGANPTRVRSVFVIGATGFVGGGVARHLVGEGRRVSGLARSDVAAASLGRSGVIPVRGDLDAGFADVLRHARTTDAVLLVAQLDDDLEARTVAALLDALRGTGATFVFTSGSGVMLERTEGAWSDASFAEGDDFPVEPLAARRREIERAILDAASSRLRTMVIRPGMIWGAGDHSHVTMTYRSVSVTGAACYVGEGLNTYANVHLDDVARLFSTALDRGRPGALYHAVAGETPTRWIAEAVARDLGVPSRSLSAQEASAVWGEFGALILGSSSRLRAPRSRDELGWMPRRTDMLTSVGDARLRRLAGVAA